jgi:fructokinase
MPPAPPRWSATPRLARALAGVINLLDPDVIVLGGGLSRMPHLYERCRRCGAGGCSRPAPRPVRTRLRPSRHGDASGVRGAAWLWRGQEPPTARAKPAVAP